MGTPTPQDRLTAEVGCLLDGAFGQEENDRNVMFWASRCGWDLDKSMVADSDEWDDAVAEAVEFLNEHVAKEGHAFGWHEGDFFYQTDEWWAR